MSIPTATLIAMGISAVFCVLFPVVLLVRWHRCERARWLPAFFGAVTFVVFSQCLEGILHYFCLVSENAVSRTLLASPWLYVLYGALAAGIFEECGRYLMYKTVLRSYPERSVAVTAGIGHGGIESMLLAGATTALYLAFALCQNAGDSAALSLFGSAETIAALSATAGRYTVGYCLLPALERVSAMLLHISLSIFVFHAARCHRRRGLLFAIALHAIFDMPPALYQAGVLHDLVAVELWLLVFALFALQRARTCYLEKRNA